MKLKHIEAEINRHLKVMPNVALEIIEEHRRLLIELNRDVEDPEMMRRPGIVWVDKVTYRLRQLAARLPKRWAIRKSVMEATHGHVDRYTYTILREMYEAGR